MYTPVTWYQVFACSDGHLILGAGNDGQFRKFCDVAGRPDLVQDPRFSTNDARVRNRDVLVPILDELFKARRRDEWLQTKLKQLTPEERDILRKAAPVLERLAAQ